MTRRNMDERMRRLERDALRGDPQAEERLRYEQMRAGVVTQTSRQLDLGPIRSAEETASLLLAMEAYVWGAIENWQESGISVFEGDPDRLFAFGVHVIDHDLRQPGTTDTEQFVLEPEPLPMPAPGECVSLLERILPCRERRRRLSGTWRTIDEDERDALTSFFGDWIETDLSGTLPCVTANPRRNTDEKLRNLERAWLAEEAAEARYLVAWERAGSPGRDPRKRPVAGDIVEAVTKTRWRDVGQDEVRRFEVVSVEPPRTAPAGERSPWPSRVGATVVRRFLGRTVGHEFVPAVTRADAVPTMSLHSDPFRDSVLLASWRAWARGGRVLRRMPG